MSGQKYFEFSVESGFYEAVSGERIARQKEQEKLILLMAELDDRINGSSRKIAALKMRIKTMGTAIIEQASKYMESDLLIRSFEKKRQRLLTKTEKFETTADFERIDRKQKYADDAEIFYCDVLAESKALESDLSEISKLAESIKAAEKDTTLSDALVKLEKSKTQELGRLYFKAPDTDVPGNQDWDRFIRESDVEMLSLSDGLFLLDSEWNQLFKLKGYITDIVRDVDIKPEIKRKILDTRLDSLMQYSKILRNIAKDRKLNQEEFECLYAKYCSLCFCAELKPKSKKMAAGEFSVNDLNVLRRENERLEIALNKKDELDYVRKSIDEIMEEIGCDAIGSIALSDNNSGTEYETYGFGEDSAINVFTSENGSVMFEVVGTADYPKEPDFYEKQKLVCEMERFCSSYDIIRQKLRQRGITVNNEAKFPPHEQFAKIIGMGEKKVAETSAHRRGRKKLSGKRYSD